MGSRIVDNSFDRKAASRAGGLAGHGAQRGQHGRDRPVYHDPTVPWRRWDGPQALVAWVIAAVHSCCATAWFWSELGAAAALGSGGSYHFLSEIFGRTALRAARAVSVHLAIPGQRHAARTGIRVTSAPVNIPGVSISRTSRTRCAIWMAVPGGNRSLAAVGGDSCGPVVVPRNIRIAGLRLGSVPLYLGTLVTVL